MHDAFLEIWREHSVERVELTSAQVMLGRAPENTICFPDDSTVSRRHAVLDRVAEGWSLRDSGSVNGTFVNGERLAAQRVLQPGDRITLGSSRLVFRVVASTAPPPEPVPARATGHGWGDESGEVTGIVRSVQKRHEGLVLQLDPYDVAGNLLPPVPVQLSPYRGGHVDEGEEVVITGTWAGGTLRATTLLNLSTGSEITTASRWEYKVLVGLAVLLVVLLIAVFWMSLGL